MKYYIYKIYNNNNKDEFYIGSTKNFSSRMSHHKKNVRNKVGKLYWCKVYQYIRANGGWDNFTKYIIEAGTCSDCKFIKQKEQFYITLHKPTLNSISSSLMMIPEVTSCITELVLKDISSNNDTVNVPGL